MKELLSEYIDGTLDARMVAAVDEHLLSCRGCREELASLRALVRELESMEPVKAPEDFLEQLHDRMASPSIFAKIVRKLFVPVKIKVPLEFATAFTMALLVFALVNVQQKERQASETPLSVESSKILKNSEVDYATNRSFEKETGKTPPEIKTAPAPKPAREKKPLELALLIERRRTVAQSAPGAAQEAERFIAKKEDKARAGLRAAPDKKAKALEPLEKKQGNRLAIKEEATLRDGAGLSGRQLNETLSNVKNLIGLVEGKVMSIDYDAQTKQLRTIHAEIPAKNYEAFIVRLRDLAESQIPPQTLPDKSGEPIEILIRFIIAE